MIKQYLFAFRVRISVISWPRWFLAGITILAVIIIPLTLVNVFFPKNSDPAEVTISNQEDEIASSEVIPAEEFVQPMETLVATMPATIRDRSIPTVTVLPGTDFAFAFVQGIAELSGYRNMIRIVIPGGVSGEYRAVVSGWKDHEYICFIPEDYRSRLYCYGPELPQGREATIQVFKVIVGQTPKYPLFAETFFVSVVPALPVPYGGGFAWPDRFNDAEEQREMSIVEKLRPLSVVLSFSLIGFWILSRLFQNSRRWAGSRLFVFKIPFFNIRGQYYQRVQSIFVRYAEKDRIKLTWFVVSIVIFSLTSFIYATTLSRTINSFDSAELITGSYVLGIVHSPGYPLYLLLAHLVSLVPVASIPLKVNTLSAVFASLTVVSIMYASWKLSGSVWTSIIAALVLAFSKLFWSQAVVAEVYSLNTLLVSLMVVAAIKWYEKPTRRTIITLMFLSGLSLTNHPSAMLMAPGLLLLVVIRGKGAGINWRAWLGALVIFFVPLLLYAYLPIRFSADPALNYVGDYFDVDLATPSGLLWMISGRMFGPEVFGRSLKEAFFQFGQLNVQLWLNFLGFGLLLVLYGLVRNRERRLLAVVLFINALIVVAFFSFYDVVDNSKMISPALVLICPLLAIGLKYFGRTSLEPGSQSSPIRIIAKSGLLIGIVLVAVYTNWHFVDRSQDRSAYEFAQDVLENVEPNALILAQWTSATPLEYFQLVEGQRSDTEILDRGLWALAARDSLHRSGIQNLSVNAPDLIREVEKAIQIRPVYIIEDDPIFRDAFCMVKIEPEIYRLHAWNSISTECHNPLPPSMVYQTNSSQ